MISLSVTAYCLHLHENGWAFINECSEPSGDLASGSAAIDYSHVIPFDPFEG